MARSGVGGALAGLGQALMRRADIQHERELMDRQDARDDKLIARQEAREDLMFERQVALEDARELRQTQARQLERGEERLFQQGLADQQADLTREGFRRQDKQAAADRDLMGRRMDREDRRAIEEESDAQLAALDNRIQDLQDMLLKGEVLGTEGEVERQIAEAEDQKLTIRSRLVNRLYEMGDPRYKDMPGDQRLYAAGYSKDQVARFMRLAQGAPAEEPESPAAPGRSDAEIATATQGADPEQVARYGLSAEDRQALGLPAEEAAPAMALPESPPPLRDMTQAGRGRRAAPANTRYNTNPAQVPQFVKDVGDLFSSAMTPRTDPQNPRSVAAAAARAQPKSEPKAAPKSESKGSEPKAEPKATGPTKAQLDGVRQSILVLLEPYGGDISKAPVGVVAAVNVLRQQLGE
jgi:hypothetical protein